MNPIRLPAAALAAALASALAACAPTSPIFDQEFGRSVPQLRAQQTQDPNATLANRDRPVDGLDGRSARESMERYYQSFVEPPQPTNVFTIGVGGDTGGGAR